MNNHQKVTVIGLTGGIGAGKSVVARVLRCKGYDVYDCDYEARRIMENSSELKCEIVSRFGDECLREDGSLAREAIAVHVFGDDDKRAWLNSKVHGLVRKDICDKIANLESQDKNVILFVESAILNTSLLTPLCQYIWLVCASETERLARACKRDGASSEKILARMKSQKNEFDDFSDRPVVVIRNNNDSDLLGQIGDELKHISEKRG
ncbi:MAG: dephospho-CoA kinase [Bacteroides sp.]|nr:dephospho-CoA kinase [Bacteroides sp.]